MMTACAVPAVKNPVAARNAELIERVDDQHVAEPEAA